MRLILDLNYPLEPQLKAAKAAIDQKFLLEKKGSMWGIKIGDELFGIKYNATSLRVYPQ